MNNKCQFYQILLFGRGKVNMKKTSKILLILGAVAILSVSAFPVNAIGYSVSFDDAQGDVRDGNGDHTSNPNIDTTLVKSYRQNENVVFEITVAGSIYTGSDEYIYMIQVGGDAADILQIMYSNDNVVYYTQQNPQDIGQGTYSVDGGKLTIQVPVSAFDSENIVLRVQNAYGNLGGSTPDAIDLAPNDGGFSGEDAGGDDTGDDDTGDDDTGGDDSGDTNGGTPGFETIVVLVALGIALIILRRRKIN